jgi:hypothetical protein
MSPGDRNSNGKGGGGRPGTKKGGGGKPAGASGAGAKGGAAKPGAAPRSRLAVVIDGVAMGDDEARALWVRFSQYMDANEGDLAGFAASEGFASVVPEHRKGQAVLVVTSRPSRDG